MINQIGYPAINGWVVTENGVLIRCSHCVPTSGGHRAGARVESTAGYALLVPS